MKGGVKLDKYEIATQLTLAAIEKGYISATSPHTDANDRTVYVAENVAAFFNKLIEKIEVTK